ncbi:MAG: PIN domain-containing protein [Nitrososphaerota archaeon]
MTKYIIDAYAWVVYLIGSDAGSKVKDILAEEKTESYTCAVTLADVISKVAREGRDFETAYDIITSNSSVVDVDEELSKETGILHAEMRKIRKDFGLADAYVLAIARRNDLKILTGDIHFKNVEEAILIR